MTDFDPIWLFIFFSKWINPDAFKERQFCQAYLKAHIVAVNRIFVHGDPI